MSDWRGLWWVRSLGAVAHRLRLATQEAPGLVSAVLRRPARQSPHLSVINEIARRSGGELYVWSGRALYRSRSGVETMPVEWPGTVVFLTLPIKLDVNVTDVVKGFDAALQKPKIQLKFNR